MESEMTARLIYLSLLLAAVAGWVFAEYRTRLGLALRTALAWGMIFVGVMAGYGLWQDIRGNVLAIQQVTGDRIEVPRAGDGHFYLTLQIDGKEVRFMVDTGATNVVLSRDDARRLGIHAESLAFIGEATTANGPVRTARVHLADVRLGDWHDAGVPAYVTEGRMDGSLLGMDYLRLYQMEIAGDRLSLTRRE
ncbi:MAG: TIGR02281 family clan AA aspartic protease [Gemmobacter sp.]|jgi:aspartyl protease family protein|nr:TIGR02281 family clan AA aspartic protease [Gemmobacter sp.]